MASSSSASSAGCTSLRGAGRRRGGAGRMGRQAGEGERGVGMGAAARKAAQAGTIWAGSAPAPGPTHLACAASFWLALAAAARRLPPRPAATPTDDVVLSACCVPRLLLGWKLSGLWRGPPTAPEAAGLARPREAGVAAALVLVAPLGGLRAAGIKMSRGGKTGRGYSSRKQRVGAGRGL